MKWIIESALRLRLVVVVLFGVLLVAGVQVVRDTPLDVFPEFAPPYVEVQTEAPGLSTAEVEALVSVPLENALNGTPDVKKIRSKSVLGLSSVVLYFPAGHRHQQRPPGRAGAAEPGGAHAARRGPAPGHALAAVLDQPGAEDRHLLRQPDPGGDDHAGPLEHPARA